MPIINSFSSLDHLNMYLNSVLHNNDLIKIDSIEKFYCKMNIDSDGKTYLQSLASGEATLDQFNIEVRTKMILDGLTESYSNLYSENTSKFYVYMKSKTFYRKNIHFDIPETLYKKMYNSLKSAGYITAATGSYVIINHFEISDQEVLNNIIESNNTLDIKVIQNLLDTYQENNNDIQYYISYIDKLIAEIESLKNENKNLNDQILNKSLTTWY